MELLNNLFEPNVDLTTIQMSFRAIIVFFFALILIRITGMRAFGIKSAFDTCIIIILGAVLGRAVVGASPFIPTLVASTAIMVVHQIIAKVSVKNGFISHLVKGVPILLYKDGSFIEKNLQKCALSDGDIMEEVRLRIEEDTLDNVAEIYMERTGKISVVRVKQETNNTFS